MQLLSTDPLILTIDDFLTDEECKHMINISKDRLNKARTCHYSKEEKKRVEDKNYEGRTNKNCWINFKEDDIIKNIYNKSAKLLNTDYRYFESLQVIYYRKNEEYKYHYDAWDKTDKAKFNKYTQELGNRVYTLLFYLNDVRKGGETGFDMTKDKIKIKSVKGKALLFKNLNEDGTLNKKSRHAGLPVIQGEKWACNFWLRDKIQYKESPKKNISNVLNKLPKLDLNYIEQNTSDEEMDLNYIDELSSDKN